MKKSTAHLYSLPVLLGAFAIGMQCCAVDPYPVDPASGYPDDVGQIISAKCATSGCHNEKSAHACAGLDLTSWSSMFRGSRSNSSVIPYSADQSFLFFSINTFPELGPQLTPTMPFGHEPLSRAEVLTIRDWINSGAPDRNGNVAFSGNDQRSKIYVANQGCDFVTVIDAETKLVMRCVPVGVSSAIESPHDIRVSPDGQYWYVTFFAGSVLQKFRTSDDKLVGQLDLGVSGWHSMNISADSRYAALSKWDYSGQVKYIDLNSMTTAATWIGFSYPHGSSFDASGRFLYVVSQQGNFIYKIDLSDLVNLQYDQITLHTGGIPLPGAIDKPYTVNFSPDMSKFFVTCQGTNELRIFNAANDSLLSVIPTSGVPQLIDFSETGTTFITCMLDTTNASTVSSVDIVSWTSNAFIKTVYPGFQERGLAVDDAHGVVYVGNRNIDPGGPAPHHTTSCNGRNGNVSIINLQTLEVQEEWTAEVGVDPYCLTIRK